jgi:hypothetical protein
MINLVGRNFGEVSMAQVMILCAAAIAIALTAVFAISIDRTP